MSDLFNTEDSASSQRSCDEDFNSETTEDSEALHETELSNTGNTSLRTNINTENDISAALSDDRSQSNQSVLQTAFEQGISVSVENLSAVEELGQDATDALTVQSEIVLDESGSTNVEPVPHSGNESSVLDLNVTDRLDQSVTNDSIHSYSSSQYLSAEEDFSFRETEQTLKEFKLVSSVPDSESVESSTTETEQTLKEFELVSSVPDSESVESPTTETDQSYRPNTNVSVFQTAEMASFIEQEIKNTMLALPPSAEIMRETLEALDKVKEDILSHKNMILNILSLMRKQSEYIVNRKIHLQEEKRIYVKQNSMIHQEKKFLRDQENIFIEEEENIENLAEISSRHRRIRYLGRYHRASINYMKLLKKITKLFQKRGRTILLENEELYSDIAELFQNPSVTYREYSEKIVNYCDTIYRDAELLQNHMNLCRDRAGTLLSHALTCSRYAETFDEYSLQLPSHSVLFIRHVLKFQKHSAEFKQQSRVLHSHEDDSILYKMVFEDSAKRLIEKLQYLEEHEISRRS